MQKDAGKIAMTPKGEYISETQYEKLDLVTYLGSLYVAKKESINIPPPNTTYWMFLTKESVTPLINNSYITLNTCADGIYITEGIAYLVNYDENDTRDDIEVDKGTLIFCGHKETISWSGAPPSNSRQIAIMRMPDDAGLGETPPKFEIGRAYNHGGQSGNTHTHIELQEMIRTNNIVTDLWNGTQAEYDLIETKSPTTLYLIDEE